MRIKRRKKETHKHTNTPKPKPKPTPSQCPSPIALGVHDTGCHGYRSGQPPDRETDKIGCIRAARETVVRALRETREYKRDERYVQVSHQKI